MLAGATAIKYVITTQLHQQHTILSPQAHPGKTFAAETTAAENSDYGPTLKLQSNDHDVVLWRGKPKLVC